MEIHSTPTFARPENCLFYDKGICRFKLKIMAGEYYVLSDDDNPFISYDCKCDKIEYIHDMKDCPLSDGCLELYI